VDGLATQVVGNHGARLGRAPRTADVLEDDGVGNDFVFFDARSEPAGHLERVATIGAICDRRRGVGADGVVFLETDPEHAYSIRYFNRDGSLAEFCGNASLCSVTLAIELGMVRPEQRFSFQTSSGPIPGRFGRLGPEVGMPAVVGTDTSFETPWRQASAG
jgi:diaminopimelate epimerase